MDVAKAREILDSSIKRDDRAPDPIFEGLSILNEVYPAGGLYTFEWHQMWAYEFGLTVPDMSEEQVIRMTELGWFVDKFAWSRFNNWTTVDRGAGFKEEVMRMT